MDKINYQDLHPYDLDQSLIEACEASNMDLIKYLLTSPDLTRHADINTRSHGEKGLPLRDAFYRKDFDLAKYLLTSPDLKEHADIHIADDDIFRAAFFRKNIDTLEYLIFDYKINCSNTMNIVLYNSKNTEYKNMAEYVEKLFAMRELNQDLKVALDPEVEKNITKKPKL